MLAAQRPDHALVATGVICDGTCFTCNCCADDEFGSGNWRCVDHGCTCALPRIVFVGDCRDPGLR